jgi:hypothetical protein
MAPIVPSKDNFVSLHRNTPNSRVSNRTKLVKDTHAYDRFHSDYAERRANSDKFNPGIIDRIEYITGKKMFEASTIEDCQYKYELRSELCTPKPQEWPVLRISVKLLGIGRGIPVKRLCLRDKYPIGTNEMKVVWTENPTFPKPTHAFNGRFDGFKLHEWNFVDLGVLVGAFRKDPHLWRDGEITGPMHIDNDPFQWFDLLAIEPHLDDDEKLIITSSGIQEEMEFGT